MKIRLFPPGESQARGSVLWLELSLFFVLCLSVAGFGWRTARLERGQALAQYRAALKTVAEGKASLAAHWLHDRRLEATVIAGLPAVRSALSTHPLPPAKLLRLQHFLAATVHKNRLAGLYLIDRQGRIFAASAPIGGSATPPLPAVIASDDVFIRQQSTVSAGHPYVVFLSVPAAATALAPWQAAGEGQTGAVVLAQNFNQSLWKTVNQPIRPLPRLRTLFLSQEDASPVCAGSGDQAGPCSQPPYRNDSEAALALSALDGRNAAREYRFQGRKMLAAIAPVPGTVWIIAEQLSERAALAGYHAELRWEQEAAVLLVLLAAILITVWRQARNHRELRREIEFERKRREDRTLADAALRDSDARYRSIVERARSAIFLVDATSGRLVAMNPWFYREFHLRPEPPPALYLWTLMEGLPPDPARAIAQLQAAAAQDHHEWTVLAGDGERVLVEITCFPIHSPDRALLCVMAREVGTCRELERQLSQAQKMEAIGRLSCGIAHDFNNVLTVIRGNADLLAATTRLPPAGIRYASQIMDATERASRLTRSLLAFSRPPSTQRHLLDLRRCLLGMDPLLRGALGEKVALVWALFPEPLSILADAVEIEQALLNLAVNAREAMPEGGVLRVESEWTEVIAGDPRVPLLPPGRYALLSVKDTGRGMDQQTCTRIFEPFFTTRGNRGTGLGLATVYGILQRNGGAVQVQSAPGEGACFFLYFPEAGREAAPAPRPAPAARTATAGETILLVEEDQSLQDLLRQTLRIAGYRVLTTTGAGQAIEHCRQQAGEIHLLIADLSLPGTGSAEAVLTMLELRPQAKVLLVSGDGLARGMEPLLASGRVRFFQKPFSPHTLLQQVRSLLGSWQEPPVA